MSYEQKDMTGSIFKNERKEKPNHPDRTGSCTIDGVAYRMSGWVKQDKKGEPYLSLAFTRKDAVPGQATVKPALRDDLDDAIPF